MKTYVKSSRNLGYQRTVDRYIYQAVRNIANYFYKNADLLEDDSRADYFVENICEDSDVQRAMIQLRNKIYDAVEHQMRL